MKIFITLLLFCIAFYNVSSFNLFHNERLEGRFVRAPPRRTDDDKNYTRWLTQNLDHFDVENLKTWQQRYFVNDEFLDQTNRNVAFLYIEGENYASVGLMTEGAWIDYAKANNAMLFVLEHRFYGESMPTEDFSVKNLKYLTSQQALADLAVFVNAANAEYNLSPDVKWVAFGGSYPGSLAAWLRLKYPHLIHAAVSSSAPILAVSGYPGYYQIVSDDLQNFNEDCYNAVKKGMADAENLLQEPNGWDTLMSLFQLCDSMKNATSNDISLFFEKLAEQFARVAQYNDNWNYRLNATCGIMTDTSKGEELNRLAYYFNPTKNETCQTYDYASYIDMLRITDTDFGQIIRPWTFQTCNEIGGFMTTDKEPHVFGHQLPYSFYIQKCVDIFGDNFNSSYVEAAVERTNTFYGGLDIEVSNVVFVHGSVDPWHGLGITKTRNPEAPAIYINGTSHMTDLDEPDENDPPSLKEARIQIGQLIQTWLNQ